MIERVYRAAVRVFLPHLAESLRLEAEKGLFRGNGAEHVVVEDRGAPRTIFSFAGGAALYAGMPTFEFRKMLTEVGTDYNLVFFRDLTRYSYHVGPQGQLDGLAFYEGEVRRLISSLGSTHHVAMGASAGAAAAMYFGTRCGFDKVIGFNQPFPLHEWGRAATQAHHYLNLKKLLKYPSEYVENSLLSLSTACMLCVARHTKHAEIWDPLGLYRSTQPRPRLTLFYGERCRPDARNARRLADLPDVKLVPVPVGLHNCASYLKRRNELAQVLREELADGLERARRQAQAG